MKSTLFIGIVFFIQVNLIGQTVGTIYNSSNSVDGYTLFAPGSSDTTYLIDNCGRKINTWVSSYKPGNAVYLEPDGHLWRTCRLNNPNFPIGGTGGRVEKYDWNGNLVWSYNISDTGKCQHHDIEILPNGNVLVLANEMKRQADCLAAGRNPAKLPTSGELWPEMILELQPIGSNDAVVVWEWHVWDHLVQDHDNTKANFGVIAAHPELMDLNYHGNLVVEDWLHANALDYNADLDQIVLSNRVLNEIWIIDHSTTISQSASHSGGNLGKGGDLLYRWGNPIVYDAGTAANQTLFGQHNPQWIPTGHPGAGNISIFNNGDNNLRPYSSADLIQTPVDLAGNYTLQTGGSYGPDSAYWSYSDSGNFYSPIISGIDVLHNGNVTICEGKKGHFFEVDSNKNLVWDYQVPLSAGGNPIAQGTPNALSAGTFRAVRFRPDYPAFAGKTLIAGDYIETNPSTSLCAIYTGVSEITHPTKELKIYPNPSQQYINIDSDQPISLEVFNALGQNIKNIYIEDTQYQIDVSNWQNGIYWFRIDQEISKSIIVQH